jgi:uncharacterized protein (UPF0210 family)
MVRAFFVSLALLVTTGAVAAPAPEHSKPRVRTVTAFVQLDPAGYQQEISDALAVLRGAKSEFEHQGYEVQTLRMVTQPLGALVRGDSEAEALALLKQLDERSAKEGFIANVGPAMLQDGDDPRTMHLLAKSLTTLPNLMGNAIIAGEDGIHWKVIRETAALVRYLADHSPRSQASFRFTATAMLKPYGPFYPGAYHLGTGRRLSIGLEGANIVQEVFADSHGDFDASVARLTEQLTIHARIAEKVGQHVAQLHGWDFMGVDPTPAPLGDVSIGAAMESYTGAKFGSSGTMTAALIITTAVKAVPVKQVGFSGLMVPVLEDKVLSQRWGEGTYGIDALLAYSAVCATGLDTVPLPGDISEEQLARILGDVASLAKKWNKPLSARLLPVAGRLAGTRTDFDDPRLFNTAIRAAP